MIEETDEDLKIPSELVPKCPVCGEEMDLNLRKDSYFVEDHSGMSKIKIMSILEKKH